MPARRKRPRRARHRHRRRGDPDGRVRDRRRGQRGRARVPQDEVISQDLTDRRERVRGPGPQTLVQDEPRRDHRRRRDRIGGLPCCTRHRDAGRRRIDHRSCIKIGLRDGIGPGADDRPPRCHGPGGTGRRARLRIADRRRGGPRHVAGIGHRKAEIDDITHRVVICLQRRLVQRQRDDGGLSRQARLPGGGDLRAGRRRRPDGRGIGQLRAVDREGIHIRLPHRVIQRTAGGVGRVVGRQGQKCRETAGLTGDPRIRYHDVAQRGVAGVGGCQGIGDSAAHRAEGVRRTALGQRDRIVRGGPGDRRRVAYGAKLAELGRAVGARDIRDGAGINVGLRDPVAAGAGQFLRLPCPAARSRKGIVRRRGTGDVWNAIIHDRDIVDVHRTDVAHRIEVIDDVPDLRIGRDTAHDLLFEFVARRDGAQILPRERGSAPEVPVIVVRIPVEDLRDRPVGLQDVGQQRRVGRREPARVESVVSEPRAQAEADGPRVIGAVGRSTRPVAHVESVQPQRDVVLVETTGLRVAIIGREADVDPGDRATEIFGAGSESAVQRDGAVDGEGIAAKGRRRPGVLVADECAIGVGELIIDIPVDAREDEGDAPRLRIFRRQLDAGGRNGHRVGCGGGRRYPEACAEKHHERCERHPGPGQDRKQACPTEWIRVTAEPHDVFKHESPPQPLERCLLFRNTSVRGSNICIRALCCVAS